MSELTHKDLVWFYLANAGARDGMCQTEFYAFKDRFLRRFGHVEGFDLQHVERVCYGCDGTGKWHFRDEDCNRCGGTGIYDVRDHWLQRWRLGGWIYHKPVDHADVYHLFGYKYPEPVSEIEGRIRHEAVSPVVARRCFMRLMLRHEPVNFYHFVVGLVKRRALGFRMAIAWRLIRLRNKLDLFPAVDETDVPF